MIDPVIFSIAVFSPKATLRSQDPRGGRDYNGLDTKNIIASAAFQPWQHTRSDQKGGLK